MRHKKLTLLMIISMFFFIRVPFSYAIENVDAPIVIEMFGRDGCSNHIRVQEKIMTLLDDYKNIIFINCFMRGTSNTKDGSAEEYEHQFCNEQAARYAQRLSFWGKGPSIVIVNGFWEASVNNILPALKMGQQQALKSVKMDIRDGILYLSVPELDLEDSGSLYLYSYMPTKGRESLVVDSDVKLTQDIRGRLAAGQSVPFVKKEEASPYRFRPVVNRIKLADWKGGNAFEVAYPLDVLSFVFQKNKVDMSYVAVVHDGKDFERVVAAGEVMLKREEPQKLPFSMPLSLEFISVPNYEILGQ